MAGRPRKIENFFDAPKSNVQFSEGQKSKGILDDYAQRKVLRTKELIVGGVAAPFVKKAGDTMTGTLTITKSEALQLNSGTASDNINFGSGTSGLTYVTSSGELRWTPDGEDDTVWMQTNSYIVGANGTGDPKITFRATTNTGLLTWDRSEDKSIFADDVDVTGTIAATTVTGANVTTGENPGHTHTGSSIADRDIAVNTADSTEIANTTTETVFDINPVAWAADSFAVGDIIEIHAGGKVQAAPLTSPSVIFRMRDNGASGTEWAKSATTALSSGAAGTWSMKIYGVVRSTGATGTINWFHNYRFASSMKNTSTILSTDDQTGTLTPTITIKFSLANANTKGTLQHFSITRRTPEATFS